MKKARKLLALFLAALMLVAMLAACGDGTGDQGNSNTDNPVTSNSGSGSGGEQGDTGGNEELETFSTFQAVYGPATFTADSGYLQYIRDNAHVNLDVMIAPVAEFSAKTHNFASAGSFPDLTRCDGPTDPYWRDIEDQGAFAPLEDYLEKYPELKGLASDTVWEWLRNPNDGHIYFLPNAADYQVNFFIIYRKDWFDQLNISEPTTVAEFEDALEIIKQEMPDVEPWTYGENAAAIMTWLNKDLATSFGGICNGWNVDENDQLVPEYMDKGMVDFVFWLQDMRKRGLLDEEVGVSTEYTMGAQKWETGRAAVMTCNSNQYFTYYSELLASDPNAQIGILPGLVGPTGIQGGLRAITPFTAGFYVSRDCKNVDRLMEFLNWQVDEGYEFVNYGIEGKTYTLDENGNRVSIPDDQREEAYKEYQFEPVRFMTPLKAVSGWTPYENACKSAGLSDDVFQYYRTQIEKIRENVFSDIKNPTIFSPTSNEIGAQLSEAYLSSYWPAGIILDGNITREEFEQSIQDWLDAGGQTILDELNELQPDHSMPDFSN